MVVGVLRIVGAGVSGTKIVLETQGDSHHMRILAAWSRSSREFMLIGVGVILAFLGRDLLLNADTWEALPAGLLFLVTGTWLICTRLHKVYLWL